MGERVTFFEIYQPFCNLEYGKGACPAVLGTDSLHKCRNTLATCPVPASYQAGELLLRFAMPQLDLARYGYVLPCLKSISVTPRRLNLAALSESLGPMGRIEEVTVVASDFLHDDFLVDKYRLERISGAASAETGAGYNPRERGTWWGKWIARNPYATNYRCAIRDGELGQPLEEMRVRWYVIDRIEGPANGRVTIKAADVFSRLEKRKAVAPRASLGELAGAISETANAATLSPSGIGNQDYPASGWVQIADEIMAFTRAGDSLTFTERGALGTEAAEHDAEDLVQLVLPYEAQRAHDIIYDLLLNYAQVPASAIDKAAWDAAMAPLIQQFTRHIGTPTPVEELIGGLCVAAGITILPNVRTGMIDLVPLLPATPTTLVDDDNKLGARSLIIQDSLTAKRDEARRVSQVWIYYGQKNKAGDLEDRRNYHSRLVVADANPSYDVDIIREFFCPWIPQFGRPAAEEMGQRILAQFRDPPWEVEFDVFVDRAEDFALAQPFSLRTADIQDASGDKLLHTQVTTAIEAREDSATITAEQTNFYNAPTPDGIRRLWIDTDANNINLRAIHDQLYVAPTGESPGEQVLAIISEGVVVGSNSTTQFALDTGDWPAGVDLRIEWHGTVIGAGGPAGKGGYCDAYNQPRPGKPGGKGGPGFKARYPVTISGAGVCAGGGGGGGGGGATGMGAGSRLLPGGGGGGGAGRVAGSGGKSYSQTLAGKAGQPGSDTAGGAGGNGAFFHATVKGGRGGDGGGPGQAGQAGQAGIGNAQLDFKAAGGAGGAAGAAIEGYSLITFDGSPSLTILGSTS